MPLPLPRPLPAPLPARPAPRFASCKASSAAAGGDSGGRGPDAWRLPGGAGPARAARSAWVWISVAALFPSCLPRSAAAGTPGGSLVLPGVHRRGAFALRFPSCKARSAAAWTPGASLVLSGVHGRGLQRL
ncbi:hypothetical protein ACRRTK_002684 [Alexandromys fortis]